MYEKSTARMILRSITFLCGFSIPCTKMFRILLRPIISFLYSSYNYALCPGPSICPWICTHLSNTFTTLRRLFREMALNVLTHRVGKSVSRFNVWTARSTIYLAPIRLFSCFESMLVSVSTVLLFVLMLSMF